MKKIFIVVSILFNLSFVQAQWTNQNLSTQEILRAVKFANENIGWIAGNDGVLFKTTNGGASWFLQNSGTANQIYDIFPVDSLNVYACAQGYILKSNNGGTSWNSTYIGSSPLNVLFFINSNIGWCVGYDGVIIKTTNAGQSWISLNSCTYSILTSVCFTDQDHGYATGVSGTFIQTTNGGTSWNYGNLFTNDWLFSVKFVTTSTGVVVGGITNRDQAIYKTTNAGLTWVRKSTPSIGVLNNVDFVDLSNGWGVGDKGVAMHTSDGGETWDVQSSNTSYDLNMVCMLNSNEGYLVGFNGFLAKYNAVPSSFIINSPSDGDNWPIGSVKHILWTGNVTNVNIDYTINGGQSWNNIATQTPNSGSYNWTIPDAASYFCKIRVSETGNPSNYGLSNSFFHIVPNNLNAVITADTLYYDTDFKGQVVEQVSGNNSTGLNLTYNWLINDTISFNDVSPFITLTTGINKIKLTVKDQSEATSVDSIFTNVFASCNITGGAINSGVSQYNNHFYVTSADKAVYEIDSLGTKLKSFLTDGSIQSVLTISQQGKLFTGSTDTRIYGFDTALIPIWDKSTGGIINYSPALSYDGSTVYCVTSSANLLAIDAQSGEIKWGFSTNGFITNSPVVFLDSSNTNIIYAGTCNGVLYAIRDKGTSGELFWQKQLSDTLFSSVAINPDGQNSMIYLGSKGGYLYRIRWDGVSDDSWKVNLNSPVYSSPIIDGNGSVYIGSKDGKLAGFTKDFTSNSVPFTSTTLESGIIGTPAIGSNGNIYVGTEKGYLYSFDYSSQNLQMKWKANLYSPISSSALVTENGLVYIGTLKGDIFVLKEYSQEMSSLAKAKWPTFKGDNLRSKVLGINITGVKDNISTVTDYKLLQNYPNPFNPSTIIKYSIPQKGNVKLTVYNLLGEVVEVLIDKEIQPGDYNITWNPRNISSGVYFYEIKADKFISIKKAIYIK
jgi:photosystem II stability/assembly factor-like uncharacterized protein